MKKEKARFDRTARIGWRVIWSVVIAWGVFVYLLLYHGWIFGIHR